MSNNICCYCNTEDAKHYHKTDKGILCSKHYAQNRKGRLGKAKEYELHGMHKKPEYRIWKGMKKRCNNTNEKQYKDYGGRGITVCERWKNSFLNFYEDMGERPSDKHSLERSNNDKGYSPSNCKWATSVEQNNNRRKRMDNTSGTTGVSFCPTSKKWKVRVTEGGKRQSLGVYITLEEAVQVKQSYLLNK